MIKVNLLRSRAVSSADPVVPGAAPSSSAKAVEMEGFQLDSGFSTFEYSQKGQVLKLLLIIGFVTPMIIFERMRSDEGEALVAAKTNDVQAIQDIKFSKEEEVTQYEGLEKKKKIFSLRGKELEAVKADRLLSVQTLDAIQTAVPTDVWLTDVVISGKFIQVNGQTLVDTGLDLFVKGLKGTKGFSNVNVPKDVKVKSQSGRTLNEFLVTLNVSESLEIDTERF